MEKILQIGVICFLVWNSIWDLRKREIAPCSVPVFLGIRLLTVLWVLICGKTMIFAELGKAIIGMIPGILLFAIGRICPQSIGQGDGIVLAVTGSYLGVKAVLTILMWAFLVAFIWCVMFLCLKKYGVKSQFPFIPFLLLGEMLYFFI